MRKTLVDKPGIYITRGGRRARVEGRLPDKHFPFEWFGRVGTELCSWTKNGFFARTGTNKRDLVRYAASPEGVPHEY